MLRAWLDGRRRAKCERTEHKLLERTRFGYRLPDSLLDPDFRRIVAVRIVERAICCGKCGVTFALTTERTDAVHGLTISSDDMDALYAVGSIFLGEESRRIT